MNEPEFTKGTMHYAQGLDIQKCTDFVLEGCCIRQPSFAEINFDPHGVTAPLQCVRECRISGGISLVDADGGIGTALVARNHFVEGGRIDGQIKCIRGWSKVAIRHNVFSDERCAVSITSRDLQSLEIRNNLLTGNDGFLFTEYVPPGSVTVCNNLRTRPGLLRLAVGAERFIHNAAARWQVGHNMYLRDPKEDSEGDPKTFFPRASSDILALPVFLSKDPANSNYLHVAADSPIGRSGVGGRVWPDYIGPFVPGPAPEEGDWFTRMRKRWAAH